MPPYICLPVTNPNTGDFPWCHDVSTGEDVPYSVVRPIALTTTFPAYPAYPAYVPVPSGGPTAPSPAPTRPPTAVGPPGSPPAGGGLRSTPWWVWALLAGVVVLIVLNAKQ